MEFSAGSPSWVRTIRSRLGSGSCVSGQDKTPGEGNEGGGEHHEDAGLDALEGPESGRGLVDGLGVEPAGGHARDDARLAHAAASRGHEAELDGVAVIAPVWPDGGEGLDHPGAGWRGRGRTEP